MILWSRCTLVTVQTRPRPPRPALQTQVNMNSYMSVQSRVLTVDIPGTWGISGLCRTPFMSSTACTYVLQGSTTPSSNDGLCCPTSEVVAAVGSQ